MNMQLLDKHKDSTNYCYKLNLSRIGLIINVLGALREKPLAEISFG